MANFLLRITVSLWHLAFLSQNIMQVSVPMNFGIKYSFFFQTDHATQVANSKLLLIMICNIKFTKKYLFYRELGNSIEE